MVEMACQLFPQLKHHIDYVEFSTPLTNNYYFAQQYVSILWSQCSQGGHLGW